MPFSHTPNLKTFNFRNLHPQVLIGTASDRYAGWIRQIYSNDRYIGRITKRTKIIGGKTFTEEILPIWVGPDPLSLDLATSLKKTIG